MPIASVGKIIIIGLMGVMLLAFVVAKAMPRRSGGDIEARVVSMGIAPSRWHTDTTIVVVQANDGGVGQATMLLGEHPCRIGDVVKAKKVGVSIYPDLSSCRPSH